MCTKSNIFKIGSSHTRLLLTLLFICSQVAEKEKSVVVESAAEPVIAESANDESGSNQFSIESAVIQHEREHSHEQHILTELEVETESIHEGSEKDTPTIENATATENITEAPEETTPAEDINVEQSDLDKTFDAAPKAPIEASPLDETFDKTTSVEIVVTKPEVETNELTTPTVDPDVVIDKTLDSPLKHPSRALLIAGPTASGKTALAISLAKQHDGIVINADSMQVYQDLHVLSARPSPEEQAGVPHLLIETEHETTALEGIRTRVETFLEIVKRQARAKSATRSVETGAV